MTNEEQKKIFARNLNYYISLTGKQQAEVAKAVGEKPTTFNMWCRGKSVPSVPKIQKLADYFGIGKTDLVDDKSQLTKNMTYAEIVHFLGKTDGKFVEIVLDYFKKDIASRKYLCEFYERYIMGNK